MAIGAVVQVAFLKMLASFRVVDPRRDMSKIMITRAGEAVAET
jgi:hypothetical protein